LKYLKMLGLAAVAAMALTAFLGAGTASATKLCTDTACTVVYPKDTVIAASLITGGSARLTAADGATLATCTGGNVSGKTGNESGAAVSGSIEELTWTGCSQTTHTIKKGSLHITHISGTHNGTVVGTESEVTVGILGTTCTYGTAAGTHLGVLQGGETPILKIETKVTKTAGGFLCPSTSGWDAEYVVTSPHALYVAA
jgi:hypothetical protein